jgi:hypothetical protein
LRIRYALALSLAVSVGAEAAEEQLSNEAMVRDANNAVFDLCSEAWTLARRLSEALPGTVQNLPIAASTNEQEDS